jgi:hypothetical protein
MKLILKICVVFILLPVITKAQLFEKLELYPRTKLIIGKYFNGTGGSGYRSISYLDSLGRIIKKESYRKKQLVSRNNIVYDFNNNKIYDVQTFDHNNQGKIDSIRYEYKYLSNLIVYQFSKLSKNDSTIIELKENKGNSTLKYVEKTFYYRSQTNTTDIYEIIYSLRFKNGLMASKEKYNNDDNSKEITDYEYFDNGRLKSRVIKRIPEPQIKENYSGGTGSDNEQYVYKLDAEGRVIKFYRIIAGKKFKVSKYKYQ